MRAARPGRAREFDWGLLIGLVAVGVLLALALYGPLLAPHDFQYARRLLDGSTPPFAPSPEFVLGSDEQGHDLLSWLLLGARSTLAIAAGAAVLRMLIGGFLGAFAGWQGGVKEEILTRVALALSSIPATVLALLGVLACNIYAGTLAFVVALGLLGWGEAFHQARRHTRTEAARPFIESARALGMTETRVVLRHLLPSIAPSMLTLAALQVSAVLLLLGEIGLIRIFVGGAEIVGFDSRTGFPTAVIPTQPDWSSMLAQTRPIISLYGSSWTILVPGLALLAAVVGTNLLGDGLARRAQRQDLYRLFSRRQSVALALATLALVAPAVAWPSRLSADLQTAATVDGERALSFGRAANNATFRGRLAGTSGARQAAAVIRGQWDGTLQPVTASVRRVTAASVRSGAFSAALGPDLAGLSLQSAQVSGTLRDLDRDPVRSVSAGTFRGQILVTSARSRFASSVPAIAFAAAQGEAVAVIIVDDDIGAYSPSDLSVPLVRIGTTAFAQVAGALPLSLDASAPRLLQVPVDIELTVATTTVDTVNVISRVAGSVPGAPPVVVLAPYDESPYPRYLAAKPSWGTASAIGVASEVLRKIREAPLRSEVIFVGLGGDAFDGAGTTTLLASLRAEQRPLLAAIVLGSLQSGQPFMQVEQADRASPGAAAPSARVGGRVADALGLPTRAASLPFQQVLQFAGPRAPVFGLSDLQSADAPEPTAAALRSSARQLLTLLSYIARNPEELSP